MAKAIVQWWLYKCEVCGMASFTNGDHGNAWYADCGSCRAWGYHDKVTIVGDMFMSRANGEEENGDSDTRNGEKT